MITNRAAHGVASHHGRSAFQIDNDEYGLECAFSIVSMMESSVAVAITVSFAGFPGDWPLGKWSIGVRVDHGHGAAVARELGGKQHCRRGICRHPLWGLANTIGWHITSLLNTKSGSAPYR